MRKTLEELKQENEAAEWLSLEGYKTLSAGYLLPDETPKGMYRRLASTAAKILKKPELEEKFFNLFWKNWLGPATPVATNFGSEKGIDISCYSLYVPDSIQGIMMGMHELAVMSKYGGGVGVHYNGVRGRGAPIGKNNGYSDGVVPFIKIQDSVTSGVAQGQSRRGASAAYLPIEHPDIEEFLNIRKPQGDPNRQCLNIHHGVCIDDKFISKVENGDLKARELWKEILKTRYENGEPYLFFTDAVNRQNPECYKQHNLSVKGSNICCEIMLHTDEDHSFVCCLSSMNLTKWDEWKDTDAVQLAIWFLDAVMEEFIQKASKIPGFERAVRFAVKSRALGLGAMGWHSLLQEKGIPFDSFKAFQLNNQIFRYMKLESEKATIDLAKEYGEPEWCKGFNRRNSHLTACAPTVSNAIISGNVSPSIEPWTSNAFARKTAKGTFIHKNKTLEKLLEGINKNTDEVWNSIANNEGSVQHLEFFTAEQKEVFLTAREINQFTILKQAEQRQKWIDQGQSINLFFPANVDPKYFHEIHLYAAKSGIIKSLYYCRTGSVLKGDSGSREYKREETVKKDEIEIDTECKACQG